MTYFIVDSSLSLAKKQITFHARVYNFLGSLKDEFSIRAFGKNEFQGDNGNVVAKSIISEIYPKKDSWEANGGEGCYKTKLEIGNNCLIYPPGQIPKGGRKKGSKDSYKRTRSKKQPVEVPAEIIPKVPADTTPENTEVLDNEIQS